MWSILGDEVTSLYLDGEEIQSIKIISSNEVIYENTVDYNVVKHDNATVNDHTDIWTVTSGASFVRESNGTTLEETDNNNVAVSTSISSGDIIDFDVYQADGGTNRAFAHISQGSTARATVMLDDVASSPSLQSWYKIRLIVTIGNLRVINRETGEYTDKSISNSFNSFRLVTGNEITCLMFRNVWIYELIQ